MYNVFYQIICASGDFTKKYNAARSGQPSANQNRTSLTQRDWQPFSKNFRRFENRINLGPLANASTALSQSSVSRLDSVSRKEVAKRVRVKDKADRATSEQVLDPSTRMILFKLISRRVVAQIHGCVSTGKEANVYYATSSSGDCAIKVYKTSILVFRDRDRYVTGEYRFRHGYAQHNPRKMVRLWAEKEMRNLSRLHQSGIPCPKPLHLRAHVLVMEFVGDDGWPCPKLKDVALNESKARELYLECVLIMRKMYQVCRLVHADLSEYNILYCHGSMCIIDVSQSVEHDHPHALEFLRKDCSNMTDFFHRNHVCVMSAKELFEFITDPTITEQNMASYLDRAQVRASSRMQMTAEEEVCEAVFQGVFIPQTLSEVTNFEGDYQQVSQDGQDIHYATVTGLKADLSGVRSSPILLQQELGCEGEQLAVRTAELQLAKDQSGATISDLEGGAEDESTGDTETANSSGEDSCSEQSASSQYKHPRGSDKASNAAIRRSHKQAVKEEKRQKRKNKVPKHVKKRKEKIGKLRR